MRVLLTTVLSASVSINQKKIASIKNGYCLLVGFTDGDDETIVENMVNKILNLRVFADENRQINLSLNDVNGEILSVSQFTLYGDVSKGRRPSFINAMRPNNAEKLYNHFNLLLENNYGKISTGIFGADMLVESVNDGPFTMMLDSKELFQ